MKIKKLIPLLFIMLVMCACGADEDTSELVASDKWQVNTNNGGFVYSYDDNLVSGIGDASAITAEKFEDKLNYSEREIAALKADENWVEWTPSETKKETVKEQQFSVLTVDSNWTDKDKLLNTVRFFGNTETTDSEVKLLSTASGFTFAFKGTEFELKVAYSQTTTGALEYLAIIVDDSIHSYQQVAKGTSTLKISTGSDELHIVKILRCGAAEDGYCSVKKLNVTGTFYSVPTASGRKIAVIGDSYCTGLGVAVGITGVNSEAKLGAGTYPVLAADELQADIYVEAKTGATVSEMSDAINNIGTYNPNVVVISLGAYDLDVTSENDLIAAVKQCITNIRKKCPNAQIIWTYGLTKNNMSNASVLYSAVEQMQKSDNKVHYLQIPAYYANKSSDSSTANFSLSYSLHAKAAVALKEKISELTSWY